MASGLGEFEDLPPGRGIQKPPRIGRLGYSRCVSSNDDRAAPPIRAVVLDVGETIVDESAEYGAWADWLGVPRHTFSAVMGAVIATGRDYRDVFGYFKPGFDLGTERKLRTEAGMPEGVGEENLYPDARPSLAELKAIGLVVVLAGNQTREVGETIRALALPVDALLTSEEMGVEKPSAAFFARVVDQLGVPTAEVLYVGDRLDNDVGPAQQAGLLTALIRRGPWGYILADPAREAACLFRLESLAELAELIRRHNAGAMTPSPTEA